MSLNSLNRKNILLVIIILVVVLVASFWFMKPKTQKINLIVSTTTSLYETGLLDILKKDFEIKHQEYNVSFISQGTGLAIETAKRGDADMILVHAPSQERAFLEEGYGVNRKIFAYNYFIIVGPKSDPAGILGMLPTDAMQVIAEEGEKGNALWVSRGDNSGTHSKEKYLWGEAEISLDEIKEQTIDEISERWYIEAGTGMTATLQLANQKNAYTLTDVATYLKNRESGNIQLEIMVESGKETLNVYSAIACNPEIISGVKFDESMLFIKFLVSEETLEPLEDFGKENFNVALFNPWVTNTDEEIRSWVEEFAYFDGTECPIEFRSNAIDLYN